MMYVHYAPTSGSASRREVITDLFIDNLSPPSPRVSLKIVVMLVMNVKPFFPGQILRQNMNPC
jgi:hypothetical protein